MVMSAGLTNFVDFLSKLLDKDGSTRLGKKNSAEILDHPFLK